MNRGKQKVWKAWVWIQSSRPFEGTVISTLLRTIWPGQRGSLRKPRCATRLRDAPASPPCTCPETAGTALLTDHLQKHWNSKLARIPSQCSSALQTCASPEESLQAVHTTALPALPCPLITMCHGWISSCFLQKQARAWCHSRNQQVTSLQIPSTEIQQCWKFQKDSLSRARSDPHHSSSQQALLLWDCPPLFPCQVLPRTWADWFRAKLPAPFAWSWGTAQIHIQPVSTAWWLPHTFFHQAANAVYVSASEVS